MLIVIQHLRFPSVDEECFETERLRLLAQNYHQDEEKKQMLVQCEFVLPKEKLILKHVTKVSMYV